RNLDPKLNLLSQLLWFGVVLLLALKIFKEENLTRRKALNYGVIYFGAMVLFLLMGYRTPIAVMLLTGVIIFHFVIKRIRLSWLFGGMAVIALFFSIFGFIRFSTEDPDEVFNSRKQPDVELTEQQKQKLETDQAIMNETPEWVRSLNGELVNGHIVLSKIIEYTREEGYLKG